MVWECGDCLTGEGRSIEPFDTLCHHCGKLLCTVHRYEITDEAFVKMDTADASGSRPAPLAGAVHCADCCRKHHSKQWKVISRHKGRQA